MAAIAPVPTGTASCMYRPRRRTSASASANANVPAATFAEYSPRLWPATNAGCTPIDCSSRYAAMLTARIAGCVILGQRQLILGPFEAQTAQRLAERGVGFVERLAADRKGLGQRLAHADLLRSLSGKNEGDQWWGTAAAAMSRSTRSMNWLEAKR